ncbi:hypothetical protein K3712_000536 [Escherichia coli]|nr:hypothetical protein [Escherichia coli]
MKNRDVFESLIAYNKDSPTGFVWKQSGKVAGTKHNSIVVNIRNGKSFKSYSWSLPRLLFEILNGFEPPRNMFVIFLDGNRDNHSRANLVLSCKPL